MTKNKTTFRPSMNRKALNELLTLARELAALGPASRGFDCSKSCNDLVRLALEAAQESAADFNAEWKS